MLWNDVVCSCVGVVFGMCGLMRLCIIISSVLAIGERSAIGLYEVLLFLSLLGLSIGIILAVFQEFGIVFVFIALLYNSVSAFIAVGPMCFICVLEMLSGPVDILGFV